MCGEIDMFIKFEYEKKKEYWLLACLSSVLCGILAYALGVALIASIAIGLLLLAVLCLRVHLEANTPIWVQALLAAFYSFFIYIEIQYTIGTTIENVGLLKTIVNWAVIYALILLVTAACGHLRYALIGVQALAVLLAVADYMVVQARGMEIQFTDLFSFGTAMAVAGQYSFTLSADSITVIFVALILSLFFILNRIPKVSLKRLRIGSLAIGTTSLVLAVLMATTSWGTALIGYEQRFWKVQASRDNGFLVSFLHSISASKVSRPSGYSKDTLEEMLTEYRDQLSGLNRPQTDVEDDQISDTPETPDDSENESVSSPNIIVIMNESFSDLSSVSAYLGNELQTDSELLPFFHSLSNDSSNVHKGFAMASVLGGNTANSEYEFLTGNSMAFLPTNSVAFNLYVNQDNAYSVVDIMNKSGYYTVGMHPEPSSNWNRTEIYEWFGFQETYFLESNTEGTVKTFASDLPLSDEDYYRGHVSDRTVYNRIIDLYEQKEEGTPLFAFAVTMQNHGGYSTPGFDSTVSLQGEGSSASVNEYLSSVQESDAALSELISYFEQSEEDTLIVFFGDHQPSLPASFFSTYFDLHDDSPTELVQAKYTVPYLYWGNFDFECDFGELTSLNYLSSEMLDIVGVEKTEYLKFTDLAKSEAIAINAYGWWDSESVFHSFVDEDSDEISMLRLYKYLQYNGLFDEPSEKLNAWFVLPDKEEDADKATK